MVVKMTYTADEIIKLFNSGHDTAQIGSILQIPESEAYKVLSVAREIKNVFVDNSASAAAALSKQIVAHDPFGWNVQKSKVHRLEKNSHNNDRASVEAETKVSNNLLCVDFKSRTTR